ncbi:MAG: transposase, partial [Gammaproteobacteria bacterium]|nr:transposase [Gammaproteobacteria bacterium]
TVYLHRHQAHRALELNPLVSHFFRFWLWLTTGMITAEWVGIHRKHHATCETVDDPNSPKILGIDKVLWEGVELYRAATKDRASIEKYRHGTPDDWIERHLYAKYPTVGVALILIIDVLLFGAMGLSIWAIQMLWIPLFAAGVINGLGHWWGYRNFESRDMSTNISPFGILVGGEELHNNHHAFPSSAKLSARWWEFDIGWMYIRMLELLHLARIKKVNRRPQIVPGKEAVDMDTVRAVILNPLHVMAHYARAVIQPVLRDEWQCAGETCRRRFRQTRWLLIREASLMDKSMSQRLEKVLAQYQKLRLVYQFRQQLQVVWSKRAESQEQLRQSLQDWCARAEATGIQSLEEFARRLRGYSVQAV